MNGCDYVPTKLYLQQTAVGIWLKARSLFDPEKKCQIRHLLIYAPEVFLNGWCEFIYATYFLLFLNLQTTILEVSYNQQNRHDAIFLITGEPFLRTSFRDLQVCWFLFFFFPWNPLSTLIIKIENFMTGGQLQIISLEAYFLSFSRYRLYY